MTLDLTADLGLTRDERDRLVLRHTTEAVAPAPIESGELRRLAELTQRLDELLSGRPV